MLNLKEPIKAALLQKLATQTIWNGACDRNGK